MATNLKGEGVGGTKEGNVPYYIVVGPYVHIPTEQTMGEQIQTELRRPRLGPPLRELSAIGELWGWAGGLESENVFSI